MQIQIIIENGVNTGKTVTIAGNDCYTVSDTLAN